jgi:hypothetical protein
MLVKIYGSFKSEAVKNSLTNGFSSRDAELFEVVTTRIGDVAGLTNVQEFRFSNDVSIYSTLGGKWG